MGAVVTWVPLVVIHVDHTGQNGNLYLAVITEEKLIFRVNYTQE